MEFNMKKILLTCAIASCFLMGSTLAIADDSSLRVQNDSFLGVTFKIYTGSGSSQTLYGVYPLRPGQHKKISTLPTVPYSIGLCWVDPKDLYTSTDCLESSDSSGGPSVYPEVSCSNAYNFSPTSVTVYGGGNAWGHNGPFTPRYVACR
jgi:hypothetical protein